MIGTMTKADFDGHVGAVFKIDRADLTVSLTLIECATHRKAQMPGGREPFTLLFRGPAEPVLDQGLYDLVHPERGTVTIFIAPVAGGQGGIDYEAAFN